MSDETPRSGRYRYLSAGDIQKRWGLTIAEVHLLADEHNWSRRKDQLSGWRWQYRQDQVERDLGTSTHGA